MVNLNFVSSSIKKLYDKYELVHYGSCSAPGFSRAELSILVAHNEDPTGKVKLMLLVGSRVATFVFAYRSNVCILPRRSEGGHQNHQTVSE